MVVEELVIDELAAGSEEINDIRPSRFQQTKGHVRLPQLVQHHCPFWFVVLPEALYVGVWICRC